MKNLKIFISCGCFLCCMICSCIKMCENAIPPAITQPSDSDSVSTLPIDTNKTKNQNDTLIIQPANNPNEIAYFGNDQSIDQSNSRSTELCCEYWTFNGIPIWIRSAFKFDYSALPKNASVISAVLTLYSDRSPVNGNFKDANYGNNNAFWVQRITTPINTANISWMTQPSVSVQGEISISSVMESFKDINIDVTGMVTDMINTNTNYGFFIRLQNENNLYTSRIFCSSKYSDQTKHPKITIIYSLK